MQMCALFIVVQITCRHSFYLFCIGVVLLRSPFSSLPMSQRYGYPHASSSDYFIDNPQVVRQLDASLAHSQPTNGSTPVDKEAPGGNGTNADGMPLVRTPLSRYLPAFQMFVRNVYLTTPITVLALPVAHTSSTDPAAVRRLQSYQLTVIELPQVYLPTYKISLSDSVFDGTTMITEIQEPLIACDSLAGMNANPANPGSVPTALDGSGQSTNVIKGIERVVHIGTEICLR